MQGHHGPLLPTSTPAKHQLHTHKDTFLGVPRKMHLLSADNLCTLIHKAGTACFMYSKDVSQAYSHPSLDPGDWPLVCFTFDSTFYVDLSLPFGFRRATSHYQDVTSLVARDLSRQGLSILNYIDDFFFGGGGSQYLHHSHRSFKQTPGAPGSFGSA